VSKEATPRGACSPSVALEVREALAQGILGREDGRSGEGPLDSQVRVVPPQNPLMLGSPVVGHLVERFRRLAEDQEPVGKSGRNPELVSILCREPNAGPLPERWSPLPQVHGDVKDLSPNHPDQLPLRL
jgi:hypothetical protein